MRKAQRVCIVTPRKAEVSLTQGDGPLAVRPPSYQQQCRSGRRTRRRGGVRCTAV